MPSRQTRAKRIGASEVEREREALLARAAGSATAEQRRRIRAWLGEHRDWPFASVLELAETFWDAGRGREAVIAIELIGLSPREIPKLPWSFLERWRQPLCTWHDTDGFGIYIFGPWLAADPRERSKHLRKLIKSEHICSRRLALVGTVILNRRRESAIPELTFELVEAVAAERGPLITKAVSWALRELTKSHAELVARYVERNRERLPAIAVREVGNKLRTGLKNPKRAHATSQKKGKM
jgi:3-methyladenine DNA glycosylase AlkD